MKAFDASKIEPSAVVNLRLAKGGLRYGPSICILLLWIMLLPSLCAMAPPRARIWDFVLAVKVVDGSLV